MAKARRMAGTHADRQAEDDARRPRDLHAETTDRIVAALEAGVRPWRRPWDTDKASGGMPTPRNGVSGRRYRGINLVLLAMAGTGPDPRWLTYRQAAARGWHVRRGERGSRVFFFRKHAVPEHTERRDGDGEAGGVRHVLLLKAYTVFHASQVDGIPPFRAPAPAEAPWRTPAAAAEIVRNSGADVRRGGGRAYYAPATDHVQVPPDAAFESMEAAVATTMHELGHWSGAPGRLGRDLAARFGSEGYAREELRAELASCFVGTELGLPCDVPNHASYVADWLEILRRDKREVFRAAADAQRIADYLLAFHPEHARRLAEEAAGIGGDAGADATDEAENAAADAAA